MELCLLVADAVWKWIRHLGGVGLILVGLADNTPFVSAPAGGMDVLVVLLSAASRELWGFYALMATVGEVAGGYVTYRLAAKGGQKTLEKKAGKARAGRIYRVFEKHGALALFVGSILPAPFPFTSLLMTAGVMQYPRRKFLWALTTGRALRFFTVAFLGRIYGRDIAAFLSRHYYPAPYILISLAFVAGSSLLIYFGFLRRSTRDKKK